MFTNGLNVALPWWAQVKKIVYAEDSPVKEKFWVQQSVKKGLLIVFWDIKRSIIIDFIEIGATVNNASYCQFLKQYFTLFIERTNHN